MSTIDPSVTLAELVTQRPELAADLEKLGLDFCCGGDQSLAASVAAAGLDLDDVTAVLEASPAETTEPEWDGMAGLVDHIESNHHTYLKDALPRLTALADKVAGVHGENHPELAQVATLTHAIRADLEPHLFKEENVLFPMIREMAVATSSPSFHCGTLVNPIRVMMAEHDNAGALLAKLRETTGDYQVPDDGCASYQLLYSGLAELEADTHMHIHKENNLLFPMVMEAEQGLGAAPQRL